jgi:hypothetical protein
MSPVGQFGDPHLWHSTDSSGKDAIRRSASSLWRTLMARLHDKIPVQSCVLPPMIWQSALVLHCCHASFWA